MPSWMVRLPLPVVTIPAVGWGTPPYWVDATVLLGFARLKWLNASKKSARIVMEPRFPGIAICFMALMSQFDVPGPHKMLRPEVPHVQGVGGPNAAGLKNGTPLITLWPECDR